MDILEKKRKIGQHISELYGFHTDTYRSSNITEADLLLSKLEKEFKSIESSNDGTYGRSDFERKLTLEKQLSQIKILLSDPYWWRDRPQYFGYYYVDTRPLPSDHPFVISQAMDDVDALLDRLFPDDDEEESFQTSFGLMFMSTDRGLFRIKIDFTNSYLYLFQEYPDQETLIDWGVLKSHAKVNKAKVNKAKVNVNRAYIASDLEEEEVESDVPYIDRLRDLRVESFFKD